MQAWSRFNCLREDKIKTRGFYLIKFALLMQTWRRFNCLQKDKIKMCGVYLIKLALLMQAWKHFNCLREDKIKMRDFYLTKLAPRVKSGINTGIEPCSIESFESSAMLHHSAKS